MHYLYLHHWHIGSIEPGGFDTNGSIEPDIFDTNVALGTNGDTNFRNFNSLGTLEGRWLYELQVLKVERPRRSCAIKPIEGVGFNTTTSTEAAGFNTTNIIGGVGLNNTICIEVDTTNTDRGSIVDGDTLGGEDAEANAGLHDPNTK